MHHLVHLLTYDRKSLRSAGKVYLEATAVLLRSVCCIPSTCAKGKRAMQTAELVRASNIIIWNRWFLSNLGLWPSKVNQPLFVFFSVYSVIHCVMAMGHLIKYFSEPNTVVQNLTETVLFVMILIKILLCRRKCRIMAKFLRVIEDDFTDKAYNNVQEKTAYLYYNTIALTFVKFSMSITGFSAMLYYFKIFLNNWSAIASGNFSYELPYRVYPFFEIRDTSTYVWTCMYLAIAIPLIINGYAGPDSFILSMALHVCGQFAALSCKVCDLLKDRENYHRHVRSIVSRHQHLITLAEILEYNFNILFLQEALGTAFLLCLTLYHMIANSEYGDDTNTIIFLLYTCCIFSTFLAYCYIGECLITETTALREAFYNSDWYNNPSPYSKLISICMTRAEKPLMLTAGRFCSLSLSTFTSIVKTSMAYLSMLRNFM